MAEKNTTAPKTADEKGTQVSAMLTPAELAALEDYRFDLQIKTRKDVKRSDVVRQALKGFLKSVQAS